MNLLTKKTKGDLNVWLTLVIGTFLLLAVVTGIIKYLQPFAKHITLNQIHRRYLLKMETDGGLSPSNLTKLKQDLTSGGFNSTDVTITATSTGTVSYGDDITLEIIYNYKYKKMSVNGLYVTYTDDVIPIKIIKSTTSKKGS